MHQHFLAAGAALFLSTATASAAVVDINLMFDDYPSDISWNLTDPLGALVGNGGGYTNVTYANQSLTETFDVGANYGTYTFAIADSYGDGLCCNEGVGGYSLSVDGTTVYTSGGQFNSGETTTFVISAPPAVPLPAGGSC